MTDPVEAAAGEVHGLAEIDDAACMQQLGAHQCGCRRQHPGPEAPLVAEVVDIGERAHGAEVGGEHDRAEEEPDDEAAEGQVRAERCCVIASRSASVMGVSGGRPIRARPARIDDALRLGMQPSGAKRPWAPLGAARTPCGRRDLREQCTPWTPRFAALPEPSSPDRPKGPQFVHLKVHSAYSLLEGAHHHPQARQAGGRATAFPRSGSPTPTTCSARWSSPTSWRKPASSRSSAARCRSISATAPQANGLQRAGANQPRSQPAGALALLASNDARLAEPHEARLAAPSSIRPRTRRRTSRSSGWKRMATG